MLKCILFLVEPLVPVGVEGLQRVYHLLRFRAIALTPFHSISLSFRIFCIPSSCVCRGLPLGLFSCILTYQAILGYMSSPILTTCPNHLICAHYIIREIVLNDNLLFDS